MGSGIFEHDDEHLKAPKKLADLIGKDEFVKTDRRESKQEAIQTDIKFKVGNYHRQAGDDLSKAYLAVEQYAIETKQYTDELKRQLIEKDDEIIKIRGEKNLLEADNNKLINAVKSYKASYSVASVLLFAIIIVTLIRELM